MEFRHYHGIVLVLLGYLLVASFSHTHDEMAHDPHSPADMIKNLVSGESIMEKGQRLASNVKDKLSSEQPGILEKAQLYAADLKDKFVGEQPGMMEKAQLYAAELKDKIVGEPSITDKAQLKGRQAVDSVYSLANQLKERFVGSPSEMLLEAAKLQAAYLQEKAKADLTIMDRIKHLIGIKTEGERMANMAEAQIDWLENKLFADPSLFDKIRVHLGMKSEAEVMLEKAKETTEYLRERIAEDDTSLTDRLKSSAGIHSDAEKLLIKVEKALDKLEDLIKKDADPTLYERFKVAAKTGIPLHSMKKSAEAAKDKIVDQAQIAKDYIQGATEPSFVDRVKAAVGIRPPTAAEQMQDFYSKLVEMAEDIKSHSSKKDLERVASRASDFSDQIKASSYKQLHKLSGHADSLRDSARSKASDAHDVVAKGAFALLEELTALKDKFLDQAQVAKDHIQAATEPSLVDRVKAAVGIHPPTAAEQMQDFYAKLVEVAEDIKSHSTKKDLERVASRASDLSDQIKASSYTQFHKLSGHADSLRDSARSKASDAHDVVAKGAIALLEEVKALGQAIKDGASYGQKKVKDTL